MSESVFRRDDSGNLIFVGNFNALYKESIDPWSQSNSTATDMSDYYNASRANLVKCLYPYCDQSPLALSEIGCGLGYVTSYLNSQLSLKLADGYDIAQSAIDRAHSLHGNHLRFFAHDILKGALPFKYDIIILSNLLWYVIHDLDQVLNSSIASLSFVNPFSLLILQNAFFKPGQQEYGASVVSSIADILPYINRCVKSTGCRIISLESRLINIPSSKYEELFILLSLGKL